MLVEENKGVNSLEVMLETIDPENQELIKTITNLAKSHKNKKLYKKFNIFKQTIDRMIENPIKWYLSNQSLLKNEDTKLIVIVNNSDRGHTWFKIEAEEQSTGYRTTLNDLACIVLSCETPKSEGFYKVRKNYTQADEVAKELLKFFKAFELDYKNENYWEEFKKKVKVYTI